jgi:hypothetical protein
MVLSTSFLSEWLTEGLRPLYHATMVSSEGFIRVQGLKAGPLTLNRIFSGCGV